MLILDPKPRTGELQQVFAETDAELAALERRIADGTALALASTVECAIALIRCLIIACIADEGKKPAPDSAADILEVFKALARGDPSWHAIRDNCRELVYYRNCINMGREDALPAAPGKMTVRTARHVYLYIRTRCIRAGRLEAPAVKSTDSGI